MSVLTGVCNRPIEFREHDRARVASHTGVFGGAYYSPLDGMRVHHRVTPQQKQHDRQGLNPGPPDLEFEVLTTRPHMPPDEKRAPLKTLA